jgi:glyoxylase-like metal-dependent hydrolase (beta-lactamase superfamily II)
LQQRLVVFENFVFSWSTATFPSGASGDAKIKSTTDGFAIRLVFDTHHTGDHAMQSDLLRRATPVAHAGVLAKEKV